MGHPALKFQQILGSCDWNINSILKKVQSFAFCVIRWKIIKQNFRLKYTWTSRWNWKKSCTNIKHSIFLYKRIMTRISSLLEKHSIGFWLFIEVFSKWYLTKSSKDCLLENLSCVLHSQCCFIFIDNSQ